MQATVQDRKREALPPQSSQTPPSPAASASSGWLVTLLRPEEGWTTFIFLGFVIFSAVWSIQVVDWVNGLGVLTWTTVVGLALGYIAAKQQKISSLLLHAMMMAVGIFFAFWQTAVANQVSIGGLWTHFSIWLEKALKPNTETNDDVMFLLFLAVLSFILAYVSVWLVARTRRPWLVILATAIVLLINLSYAPDGNLIYLTIFLLAGLLLVVRFNLSESYRQWRRRSLRYTADLGWDFMVAGMLFSVGILVFGWLLPEAGPNPGLSDVWTNVSNPWVSAQQLWTRLFQVRGGPGTSAYFSDQLQLTGNVDLPNVVILTYTSHQPDQYLMAVTQDYFDGHITWTSTGNTTRNYNALEGLSVTKSLYTTVEQNIHLVNPPNGSPNQYIFGAADPISFSVPVGTTQDSSGTTSYYAREPLVGGENYTVTSDVSTADENTLRQVPLPVDAQSGGDYFYPQNLLNRYTEVPPDLQSNQQIHQLLNDWTGGQNSMYDIAQAIETHLRSDYTYSPHNANPPSDQDSVAWFLLQTKQGFCTYFASAMVMLARMMGLPARVASGYTNGTSDGKGHFVVKGTDAHTWAQIYFAKYGWVNFEPSAGFSSVTRPVASTTPTVTQTPGTGQTPGTNPTPINHRPTGDTGPTGSASEPGSAE